MPHQADGLKSLPDYDDGDLNLPARSCDRGEEKLFGDARPDQDDAKVAADELAPPDRGAFW